MKYRSLFYLFLFVTAFLIIFLGWQSSSASSAVSETRSSILYVKPGAGGTCTSWVDACELQTAIYNATVGDQIWVAEGTYKPTTSSYRESTFQLMSGIEIYGGFPAAGGAWEERDWITNPTTLSGDIGLTDNSNDNSYHVVTGSGVDVTAVLDGFTISSGNANGSSSPNNTGGGMYNNTGSPSLTNVTFSGNMARDGGGMSNITGDPTLTNVTFSANTVTYRGGGMYSDTGSPSLIDVTFSGNSASYGGGMYSNTGSPSLTNVTFSNNTADNFGGGMYKDDGSTTMTNVTFSGNSAVYYGGGMYNSIASSILANITFTGNSAEHGGGMSNLSSSTTITNAIFWGNTPNQFYGTGTITFSLIQGSYAGTGNIDTDPLLGPLGDNGGFTQTHALGTKSPAIDSGNPEVCPDIDQRAYARPIDGDSNGTAICDMGAYEYESYPAVLILTVDVEGNGSVALNPSKSDYLYGEKVTLTPVAEQDWVFIGWSGDATGTNNPMTITIVGNMSITANFVYNAWVLNVSVTPEASGSVMAVPLKDTYHYGEVVTLTATANPGRSFAGWSGDASGTENQIIVTMLDNLNITANFTLDEYSLALSVNPVGTGTVSINPSKPNYHYGDVVTLTANPNPDWYFDYWSGAASGLNNPLTVTIVGNTVISATFIDTLNIYLPLIIK